MSSDLKPIHPEVMYAERSSETDPEKVSFLRNYEGVLADHTFSIYRYFIYTERHLLHYQRS